MPAILSGLNVFNVHTVKPVCNDHLYDETVFWWRLKIPIYYC